MEDHSLANEMAAYEEFNERDNEDEMDAVKFYGTTFHKRDLESEATDIVHAGFSLLVVKRTASSISNNTIAGLFPLLKSEMIYSWEYLETRN
ncbi:hypothetical protein MMC30_000970 [Trapelia coarctata]|nr:hypothetical protein [Trapelia coarctata]